MTMRYFTVFIPKKETVTGIYKTCLEQNRKILGDDFYILTSSAFANYKFFEGYNLKFIEQFYDVFDRIKNWHIWPLSDYIRLLELSSNSNLVYVDSDVYLLDKFEENKFQQFDFIVASERAFSNKYVFLVNCIMYNRDKNSYAAKKIKADMQELVDSRISNRLIFGRIYLEQLFRFGLRFAIMNPLNYNPIGYHYFAALKAKEKYFDFARFLNLNIKNKSLHFCNIGLFDCEKSARLNPEAIYSSTYYEPYSKAPEFIMSDTVRFNFSAKQFIFENKAVLSCETK